MSASKFIALGFFCGMLFGVGFTLMALYYQESQLGNVWRSISPPREISKKDYESSITEQIVVGRKEDYVGNLTTALPEKELPFFRDRTDNVTAQQLYEKVRILCWVMTSPSTLKSKAIHVRDTWSKRCNIRLFMSSVEDEEFPAVGLPVNEGRDQLYEKTKAAFRYVLKHYKDKADWFMKADDDTFVIVENLRYLLKDYDPKKPIFFGRKFSPFIKQGYMSGGAGYVLSNEALTRFIAGLDSKKCAKGGGVEDVEIGKCMDVVGVVAGDSRDQEQRETFHPLGPQHHLIPGSIPKDNWFWKYNYYPTCLGVDCSTNYPITFHYVSKEQMYILEYTIYKVKLYGVTHIYNRYFKLPYEERSSIGAQER